MTTITKLGIQGIRSFDHERLEVIDFERPVTLIVGPNGSGKTTIIECLKMASAGVLPPNAKNGHGFVHDPQVARLPEVKGQIRMLFRTGLAPRDREICAIRSFQLSNRRIAGRVRPQYKALESVLRTMADDGSKASLSHRCADMDTQVPELMGVSRAVLESVIFCHQEESNWPLMDAGAVKKRFDDIFGATRYTKALENIKVLQREWTRTKNERRAEADLSQAHLDQATKLSRQKEEREGAAEEISAQVKQLDTQLEAANEASQAAEMELVKFDSRGVRVAEVRSLKARCEKERGDVTRSMEERGQDVYRESLEELQVQAKQFNERVIVESEQKVQQAKRAHAAGEVQYKQALEAARKLREDMGETVAAAELLASRKVELGRRLEKAGEPSVAALRARLDALAAEFAQAEREQRQRDAASEEALAAAEQVFREATLEASRNEARAEDSTTAIRRLEEEAKTLSRAVPDLESLMRQMRESEAALAAEGSEAKLRALEKQQEDVGRRRHDLQYSISRKSSEVAQLEAQSDAHVEVDGFRRRLREMESELGSKLAEVRPKLVGLLGHMPEASEAEAKTAMELSQIEEQLKKQRQRCQDLQQKQSASAAHRGAAEAELRRLQAEEGRLTAELGAGGSSDFHARLAHQKEQVELTRKDLAMTESAKHMYEKFREKSRAKGQCQFCRRAFATQAESACFEESVEKLIVKIPAFLQESHRRLTEAQNELGRLDTQRPRWDRLEQLQHTEIPQRQQAVTTSATTERTAQTALDPEEREKRRLEERLRQLHEVRSEAGMLQRAAASVEDLRAAVRAKESRLLGSNSKVSLQAERDQLRTLQEQLCDLGREEDSVRSQRDLLAKQQEQLRAQIAEQKGRLQLLQAQVARRGDVDRELVARQANLHDAAEAAKRARALVDEKGARAKQLREERASTGAKFRRETDARDGQVRSLQREVDALVEMERSIETMKGRVENAEGLKAKMAAADTAVRTAERELEGLKARQESEEERRRKREEVRECLQMNLRLKGLESEVKQHEAELAELLRSLGGRDLDAMKRDLAAARGKVVELQKTRSYREGELAHTREAAHALALELAGPLYSGVEQRHREAIIKHESAAYAAKDLGRYHAALDKALMRYHAMKMAEINKTIKDLWQRVYRGRDIDHIAIRSDTDDADSEGGGAGGEAGAGGAGPGGKALRSYNYRVVMVCGDAEMDMRGRCSAGQRVLSSLIIRLALADSFCVNCGVLALDEPTTNLDGANIRGLAEALAALIESRRRYARFQLILITHDEVFVDYLSQLQVADWYYHIQKDAQGCSKIERREIRLLAAG